MGTARDVSDHKRAEERARRQNAVVAAINRVLRETLASESDEEVARACLTVAEELTGSSFGFINEMGEAGRMNTIAISDPTFEACRIPGTGPQKLRRHMEVRGLCGRIVESKRPVMCNDLTSHPDWASVPDGHPPIACFLGVPLTLSGHTIGIICLANKSSGYNLEDQQAVEALSAAFVEALMHQRANRALADERRLLRTLIDTLPDLVYVKDVAGRMILINEAQARVARLQSPGEAVGKTDLDLFPSDLAAQYMEADRAAMRADGAVSIEEPYVTPDGEARWLSSVKAPLHDGRGAVVGTVGMSRDITRQKQADEELRRLNRALHMLSECNQAVVRASDEPGLLQEICRNIVEMGGYAFAWIGFAEQDQAKTIRPVAFAGLDGGHLQSLALTWAEDESPPVSRRRGHSDRPGLGLQRHCSVSLETIRGANGRCSAGSRLRLPCPWWPTATRSVRSTSWGRSQMHFIPRR